MGASLGRTLWSLAFWPERQTDSVLPSREHPLTNRASAIPGLTFPSNRHAPSSCCPWRVPHRSLCQCRGSLPFVQDFMGPHSPSITLQSGESRVRWASACQATYCLLPGSSSPPMAAFSVCSSPLPGPALQHRLSPALVSRIFAWHMAPHCVLGVFVVTAGALFRFSSATRGGSAMVPWVGNLMGKTPRWFWTSCSRALTRCGL